MRRLQHPTLPALLLTLAMLLASGAAAQGANPATWRALYVGTLGDEAVTLDLTLGPDGFAFARLNRPQAGETLDGVGSSDMESGALELSFHRPPRATSAASAVDYAYFAAMNPDQQEAEGGAAATLVGRRVVSWEDDGDTLEASVVFPGAEPRSGTLTRAAQYAFRQVVEGRIDASFAAPRFGGAWAPLDEFLAGAGLGQLERFIREGRALVDDEGGLGWGWSRDEVVDQVGSAGPYRSLLASVYTYTGGAHPNTFSESYLARLEEDGTVTIVRLDELFQPGTAWLEQVSDRVLEELARQEAYAVTNGEIIELGLDDLATFTLGPAGLRFHFDPYEVGPYVQGPFAVTLPYEGLAALAAEGGALAEFMTPSGR